MQPHEDPFDVAFTFFDLIVDDDELSEGLANAGGDHVDQLGPHEQGLVREDFANAFGAQASDPMGSQKLVDRRDSQPKRLLRRGG
jgi:hypothetical protein